jgi:hypothetical protein
MTAANKHLIISCKQITSRSADLRHLCTNFDHNRPLILQDVQQQFERGTSEKRKQKLEHSRYALMNHVALVWVRLDDVLHSQGGTMADPPKIRERKALENKVVMLELELRKKISRRRSTPTRFSMSRS